MDKSTSKELAKAAVERFILRFDESYRQLVEYAALPFVLTPELLNYIHNQFLWKKVEWVAEVDLLLSDLCRPIGYEQYAMDNSVRNYLLEKMNQTSEGQEKMQKVARLLLSYIRYLGQTNPYIGKQELEAQQWGAMVCLNDQRETAVKEIVSRFLDASGKGSNNKKFNRDEFARLVQIVQELEPQLSQYKSLVDYAKLISKLLSQESVKEIDLNHSYSVIPGWNLTFPEDLVEEVLESKLKQEEAQAKSIAITQSDIDKLVNLIANQAANAFISPQEFFRNLINRANLPQKWVISLVGGWTGNPNDDARKLINWALAKNKNPNDKRFTILGSILQVLLTEVGFDDAKLIASLIIVYQLYKDKKLLEQLQITYQVPISANKNTTTTSDFGSEINWEQLDANGVKSWFKPEPDFLDVSFLNQAIQNATSVCRIETSNPTILGTGFLIAPKLVLTTYHVVCSENIDIQINPSDIVLRFGFFTSTTGDEDKGQTFKLVNDKPILESSPINKLDYALLQVEDSITQAKDINQADCDFENLPTKGTAINILQFPEGSSMKISMSSNGVINVSPDSGLIQYVTKTSSGSSGSPCFNEDWKVVALHHAQKATHFGSIREGILLSAIYKEIQQHL